MDTIFYASASIFIFGLIFIAIGSIKEYLMKNGNVKSKVKTSGTISSIEEKKVIENN